MAETTGVSFLTVRRPEAQIKLSAGLFFSLVCILVFFCREAGHIGLGSTHLTSFYLPFPFKGLISKQNTPSHSTYCGGVVESLSRAWLLVTPSTVDHWAPLFMGFPREEYWSEMPFPSPGDLPNPGLKLLLHW